MSGGNKMPIDLQSARCNLESSVTSLIPIWYPLLKTHWIQGDCQPFSFEKCFIISSAFESPRYWHFIWSQHGFVAFLLLCVNAHQAGQQDSIHLDTCWDNRTRPLFEWFQAAFVLVRERIKSLSEQKRFLFLVENSTVVEEQMWHDFWAVSDVYTKNGFRHWRKGRFGENSVCETSTWELFLFLSPIYWEAATVVTHKDLLQWKPPAGSRQEERLPETLQGEKLTNHYSINIPDQREKRSSSSAFEALSGICLTCFFPPSTKQRSEFLSFNGTRNPGSSLHRRT